MAEVVGQPGAQNISPRGRFRWGRRPKARVAVSTTGNNLTSVRAEGHTVYVPLDQEGFAERRAGFVLPQPNRAVGGQGRGSVTIGVPMGWPVAASHNRNVLSHPPEAMMLPAGAERQTRHRFVTPGKGWPTGLPVVASQIRTVASEPPETTALHRG